MKKWNAMLLTGLSILAMANMSIASAQEITKSPNPEAQKVKTAEIHEKLYAINANSTTEELELIKTDIKLNYKLDFIYTAHRNLDNEIISLLANIAGNGKNTNLSLSGDQPIGELFIIKKKNGDLGIWSERTAQRGRLFANRAKLRDSMRLVRQEKIKARLGKQLQNNLKPPRSKTEDNYYTIKIDPNNSNASPLMIVNGEEKLDGDFKNLNPDEIESVNVIKGDEAIRLYGEKGKNGVVVVTLKK